MASVDSLSIQITASTKSAKDKVDALVVSLNSLVSAINQIDTTKFDSLANAASSLSTGLNGLKGTGVKQVEKMAQALQNVGAEKNVFEPIVQGEQKVTEEAKAVSESAQQIDADLNGIDGTTLESVAEAATRVASNIETTTHKMSGFKSLLANLKIIVPTEGLENVNKKIDKLSAKAQELREQIEHRSSTQPDYVDGEEIERDQKKLEGLINELDRLKLKKQELESHGGFKLNLGATFSDVTKVVRNANNALNGFISKLHKTKSASRSTTKGTKEFTSSAKKLANELFRVSKMLKLMITRMALRTIIKEVGNGFKSLALHSEEFNQTMSALINSSKKLGYSFSAMVAPLINALAPALIYLLNILTRLINAINQIFSALSGKSSYNKAKDFAVDWAEEIADADKEAKKLKKTVLGFDELNQMQEQSSASKTDTDKIKDMFDTVAIETKWKKVADYIKNLAKKLFDPIKKAWAKVGDFVKKSWKYALGEVLKLGKSVARDFWKVWQEEKTQKIFENILKVIGYIGIAVGNLAKRFREAWDENGTGLRILRAIRDIVLIITKYLVIMAKATAEWADKLDFRPLLRAIAAWLESLKPVVEAVMGIISDFYEKVVLKLAKWVIEEGMPKLIKVFTDFNNEVKWDQLRQHLSELWDAVEPFMETVGEGLIIFIDRVADGLADFLNSETFVNFLHSVEEWMTSVTAEDVANAIEKIVKFYIGVKIAAALLTIFTKIVGVIKAIGTVLGFVIANLTLIAGVVTAILSLRFTEHIMAMIDPATYEKYDSFLGMFVLIYDTIDAIIGFIDLLADKIKNLFSGNFIENFDKLASFLNGASVFSPVLPVQVFGRLGEAIGLAEGKAADFGNTIIETGDKAEQAASKATDSINNVATAADNANTSMENVGEGGAKSFEERARQIAEESGKVSDRLGDAKNSAGELSSTVNKTSDKLKDMEDRSIDLSKTLYNTSEEFRNLSNNIHDTKAAEATYKATKDGITKSSDEIEDALKGIDTSYIDKLFKDLKLDTLGDYEDFAKGIGDSSEDIQNSIDSFEFDDANLAFTDFELNTDKTMDSAVKTVDDDTKEINKSLDTIKSGMTKDKWTFQGVADGLGETFKRAREAIKREWNQIADTLNGEHTVASEKIKIDLPKFARGGFPENGLFMANSSELVGRFDNGKTAVANNEQIIAGISQGVYSAVTAAMAKSNSGNAGYIANTIVVDGEVIARTVTKAQQKQNMRYSPVMG